VKPANGVLSEALIRGVSSGSISPIIRGSIVAIVRKANREPAAFNNGPGPADDRDGGKLRHCLSFCPRSVPTAAQPRSNGVVRRFCPAMLMSRWIARRAARASRRSSARTSSE
jgi:hypothetical protein